MLMPGPNLRPGGSPGGDGNPQTSFSGGHLAPAVGTGCFAAFLVNTTQPGGHGSPSVLQIPSLSNAKNPLAAYRAIDEIGLEELFCTASNASSSPGSYGPCVGSCKTCVPPSLTTIRN